MAQGRRVMPTSAGPAILVAAMLGTLACATVFLASEPKVAVTPAPCSSCDARHQNLARMRPDTGSETVP